MATMPHCDDKILHAPGECIYCDKYPKQQAKRIKQSINFTGHNDPNKSICPAEQVRPLDRIERWGGNIPMTKKMQKEEDIAWSKFFKELDEKDLWAK